jgi:hypothetical protein
MQRHGVSYCHFCVPACVFMCMCVCRSSVTVYLVPLSFDHSVTIPGFLGPSSCLLLY